MRNLPTNLHALRAAWRITNEVAERTTPCFSVTNANDGNPKLYVYDLIGGFENDSADFVKAVHDIDAKAIDLYINSPGGFVYDAMAMYEALLAHPANVTTYINGMAASAASWLALAGDTVEIAKAGRMMIHDVQLVALGSPSELREYADLADAMSNDIAGYYADRAGGKPEAWRAAMTATTWYSASEAVDAKLADRVTGGKKTSGPDNRTRLIRARAAITLKG